MRRRTLRPSIRRSSLRHGQILGALALAAAGTGLAGCHSTGLGNPSDIAGRYVVTVCDADIQTGTPGSGELGVRTLNAQDTLTVVALPISEGSTTKFAQVQVSNSALGPPTCLAVTHDGRYAFVVEYRGPAKPEARTVDDLPPGNTVTAVDLTNPLSPTITATTDVVKEPIAVAVHPQGTFVAVAAQEPRRQVVILPVKNGQFAGEPAAWPLLGLDNDEAKPSSIAWHPSGNALAVTLMDRGEVMFYRFRKNDKGELQLAPWGPPVKVGKAPFAGAFTPDGRYFIVNNVESVGGVQGYDVGVPEGELVSIRMGDMPGEVGATGGGPIQNIVVSTVKVGVGPVGMAINTAGTMLATCNVQHSHAAENIQQGGGSVSLVMLAKDGTLTNTGEFPVNAVPAGIAFDGKGSFLCVSEYRSLDPDAKDGEIGFWHIGGGSHPTLVPADLYVAVGHGPHGVLIVR